MLLSYYIERRKIKLGGVLDFIITLPYMLPEVALELVIFLHSIIVR